MLAVLAKHHGVPFYVASPVTTLDLTMASGDTIEIEERKHEELTSIAGVKVAADGIGANISSPTAALE